MTKLGLLGAATEKQQFELVPIGEYVWTLWDMVSETGQYGDQVKWVWLLSKPESPDTYLLRNDGNEREIWQFTKPSLARGTRARTWAEALLGRELKTGEEPEDSDLTRRRMIALLVHKKNKNDPTIQREAISEEIPARPFTTGNHGRPAPAAAAPVATPPANENDRAPALAELKKSMRRASVILDVADFDQFAQRDTDAMTAEQLRTFTAEVEDALKVGATA